MHGAHLDQGSNPAAVGGPPGPSGQHWEGDDPFLSSTNPQPSHQVSTVGFNFILQYLANLIQGGLHSPQDEEFDLRNVSPGPDDSPEHGLGHRTHQGHTSGPATPTRHETRAKKAGTRLASSGDDTFQFFELIDGARECTFCL